MSDLNLFIKILKKSPICLITVTIFTLILAVVPETVFGKWKLLDVSYEANIILMRFLLGIILFVFITGVYTIYLSKRNSISIEDNNYSIKVEYGDLFKIYNCKKVIPFDECFTTFVGSAPSDINPDSICGQYLMQNPIEETERQRLISCSGIKPASDRSEYQNKIKYDSGKLVPRGEYLLMAFAKLDKDGLGKMTRDEFNDCLTLLWKEIDMYYGQKDVCIPVLGSGVTRMDGDLLTQQELLDMIIWSYKLSSHKIKRPAQLRIVCKKREDFSLNNIDSVI